MTNTSIESQPLYHQRVKFRERSHCISCGSSKFVSLWEGQFSDEPTHSFMARCHYSEDVTALLEGESFSLLRCENCGTLFHQRILTPEYLNLLYSEWINDTQIAHLETEYQLGNKPTVLFERGRQNTKHLLRLQKLLTQNNKEQLRILDYGCGDGEFLALAKLFGFETCGIDFSSVRNERATKMGITIFTNWENMESEQIAKMHVVTLFQVLEHLEEPLEVLNKIADKMEDGGILIVEVPDCRGITQPQNFFEFHNVHPLEHINAFTPISLKRICEQAGFVSIKRIPAHVTTRILDIFRTTVSHFIQPNKTAQYFRLCKN